MASLLDKYGLREVMNCAFYALDAAEQDAYLAYYFDSLKVSSIEESAEETEHRGGIGNALLITWDHSKSITLNIEDALMSPLSFGLMHTSSNDLEYTTTATTTLPVSLMYVATTNQTAITSVTDPFTNKDITIEEVYTVDDTSESTASSAIDGVNQYRKVNQVSSGAWTFDAGKRYLIKGTASGASTQTFTVSADKFPGTYHVVGDTLIRNAATGNDEYYRIEIFKAKVNVENTITLEAGGDASTFSFNLKALKDKNNNLIRFTKYSF